MVFKTKQKNYINRIKNSNQIMVSNDIVKLGNLSKNLCKKDFDSAKAFGGNVALLESL